MTYHLVLVTPRGYLRQSSFTAASMSMACREHKDAWFAKKSPFALVMRRSDGVRFSFEESRNWLAA